MAARKFVYSFFDWLSIESSPMPIAFVFETWVFSAEDYKNTFPYHHIFFKLKNNGRYIAPIRTSREKARILTFPSLCCIQHQHWILSIISVSNFYKLSTTGHLLVNCKSMFAPISAWISMWTVPKYDNHFVAWVWIILIRSGNERNTVHVRNTFYALLQVCSSK